MQIARHSATSAYNQVGVETGVSFASPHQLILLLYEGALIAIADAKLHMRNKEVARKGEAISKAISIIQDGLILSLDEQKGEEIAKNLKALYEYVCNRLALANAKNQTETLDEVAKLLLDLKGAWESIGKTTAPVQPEPTHLQQRAAVSYGKV